MDHLDSAPTVQEEAIKVLVQSVSCISLLFSFSFSFFDASWIRGPLTTTRTTEQEDLWRAHTSSAQQRGEKPFYPPLRLADGTTTDKDGAIVGLMHFFPPRVLVVSSSATSLGLLRPLEETATINRERERGGIEQ
eukprot:gene839-476_t